MNGKTPIAASLALIIGGCALFAETVIPSEAAGYKLYRMGHYAKAMRVWKRAAASGDAGAAFRLAAEYLDAKIVKRDVPRAVAYLKTSAAAGEPRAQRELGTLHDHGQGVPYSLEEAARWYLAAARAGLPDAQHNIAVMFENGEGVAKDLPQAYLFYSLAIENDFRQFSQPALEKLIARMTPQERRRGEELVEMRLEKKKRQSGR